MTVQRNSRGIYIRPLSRENTASGFSATLFKKIGEDEYYYACRGTELTGFGWQDLIKADIGDIVVDGLAIHQIVDMYNDWQRIKSTGVYIAAKLDLLLLETASLAADRLLPPGVAGTYELYLRSRNDVIIDLPSGRVYTIKTVDSDQLFTDDRARGAGIAISGGVTTVGHSLGGHLADAFPPFFLNKSKGGIIQ
ncbi:MAG: hypothetical protein KJ630_19725 [Proteobacteria bacterium]|nr:hypothetical protein [Pseudomonadota bacterium]